MEFSISKLYDAITVKWKKIIRRDDFGSDQSMSSTERLSIFLICYLFALAMWSLVNLGREFELSLSVPITILNIPEDMVLTDDPIKHTQITVGGEGWMLMGIYNGEPNLEIDASENSKKAKFNLLELMKKEMNSYPSLNLVSVEPSQIDLVLKPRVTKRVPIIPKVNLSFKQQFSFLDEPRIFPDSVTLSGSSDVLKTISFVETTEKNLSDVKESLDLTLDLISPAEKVRLDRLNIRYRARVSEFTEGEIRIFVKTENLPKDTEVRYSPAVISVRYDVPIEEYATSQDLVPYSAFVNYREIADDTTGFITPIIQNLAPKLHLRLRSYQPKRVSYYNVIKKD
jgi:hypothetical protein